MLIENKTCILDKAYFIYEQLFHPVPGTACKICQRNYMDKLNLLRATDILSLSDQLHYL